MENLLGEKQLRKAGSLFGKYRLLRPLKRSPFLENYLAQAESPPHTIVVLKRLHPLVIHRTDWVSLFLDEVKRAATLWHPNIIRIYDLGEIDGIPYFVQPYLFGKKLQTLLARSRTLPIPTGMALLLVRQLLETLRFAHTLQGPSGKPMAHGGLHPERIFIGYDGVVGVGDFGLGWLEDPRSAVRSRYRAPESISDRKGKERAEGTPGEDLFAASAILCELLGEFPEPAKPEKEPWGYLPASIRSILMRGLAFEPTARFQTAGEMIEPIESILQNEYPRLNLSNYIQAFFGKEIEAERRAFARFAPPQETTAPGEPLLFERPAPPADATSHTLEPASTGPTDPEAAASESPAVVETVSPVAPDTLDLPPAGGAQNSQVEPAEKKAASWQTIWWGLFGLLITGFMGVLLFSLYRSSSDKMASTSPPVVETRRDPAVLPSSTMEEKAEGKKNAVPSEGGIAPSVVVAEQPVAPEPPPPSPAPAPAPVVTVVEAPSPPIERPDRDQPKKPTVLPAPKTPPAPLAASPVGPSGPLVAGKMTPKGREEVPPQPKVEEIPSRLKSNEEMLHELIERQRRAYQSQDWVLYRQDVAEGREFEPQIDALFGGTEPIRVEFEIFGLKIRGNEADLSLMQTARLRKGKAISLQKALLFWKLKKEKERWKIEKFNVIEKYPPIEVG
jgi:serine/threonine-protein kinase